MVINIILALAVLVVNVSVPAWAASKNVTGDGLLFKGSCGKVKRFALIGHAVINICGTLLLAASNYAMQVLVAPTRQDIDSAHLQKAAFFIGSQSLRNLRSVTRFRALLWVLLSLASVPLHLL